MSFKPLILEAQNYAKSENEQKNSNDPYKVPSPLSVTSNAFKTIYPKNVLIKPIIKYGSKDDDRKSEINNLYMNESKEKENIFKLNNGNINSLNYLLNVNNSSDSQKYGKDFHGKTIESEIGNFINIENMNLIPDYQHHLYTHHRNYDLFNQISIKIPMISRLFTQNKNMTKNIIWSKQNIFKPQTIDSNSSDSSQSECLDINEERSSDETNEEIGEIANKEDMEFNISTDFLLNFNIIDVNIKEKELNQNHENLVKNINLKNCKNFINDLFVNNIYSEEMKNNFNGDFIEHKILENKEKKEDFHNRNNFFESEEFENLYKKLKKKKKKYSRKIRNPFLNKKINKKTTAKSKKENKLNQRKNGPKIHVYLNQIEMVKSILENFPFFPALNIKINMKIYLLESLTQDKKDLIKAKKKVKLIKDERNLKYIKNKIFEIIYQDKEEKFQKILHINGFNILYLILFYYYKLQINIKKVEQKFYSNQSVKEMVIAAIPAVKSIRYCNRITNEIINKVDKNII